MHISEENKAIENTVLPKLNSSSTVEGKNLPFSESQSIISLELLDKTDESYNTDLDTSKDPANILADEDVEDKARMEHNILEENDKHLESLIEEDIFEDVQMETEEDEATSANDFPDIDFSSVSMGVLELDTDAENLLGMDEPL